MFGQNSVAMENINATRRTVLKLMGGAALLGAIPFTGMSSVPDERFPKATSNPKPKASDFVFCLNMSTIRGQNLGFVGELETAAKAGFPAVEIWIRTLQDYLEKGGTLKEAKTNIDDLGLTVEDSIGFAPWIVDDDAVRTRGLEQVKKEMDMLAAIGCKRIAAPPAGATREPGLDLNKAAGRYRAILELGDQSGVIPHLEIWGHSQNLNRLSQVLYVATETGHPSARILLDVYHLYKGGSSIDTLHLAGKAGVEMLHINDYPDIPRETITDGDRVYPGEGVGPVQQIVRSLRSPDRPLVISLEVFNKKYWEQDALEVCRTGLEKMKAAVAGV